MNFLLHPGRLFPPWHSLELPADEVSLETKIRFWQKSYMKKVWDFLSYHGFRAGARKLYGQTYFAAVARARAAWSVLPRVSRDAFGLAVPYPQLDMTALELMHERDRASWELRRCFLQTVVYSHIYDMRLDNWENIPNEHIFAWWEHRLQQKPCPF